MSRTQAEIVARYESVKDDDWLGFKFDVLIGRLDYSHAEPYLPTGVTLADWTPDGSPVETQAREYLEFAIGKIDGHRGISAGRSVDKLTEMAWLMGRDDVVTAMDDADYTNYGAPKVKAFAEMLGWPWPDDPALNRMADGLPCEHGCMSGCDQ